MAAFKLPDLTAPRFRRSSVGFANNTSYNNFIKSTGHNISIEEYKKIIKTFNGLMLDDIINSMEGVKLPEGLGIIFIGSCEKTKKINPDYKESANKGIIVNHRNWDSDNYLCKIFYTNYGLEYKLKDRELWSFKANKDFRSRVSKEYKTNHTRYRIIDNRIKISEMFRKQRVIKYLKNKELNSLKNYNEFELDE